MQIFTVHARRLVLIAVAVILPFTPLLSAYQAHAISSSAWASEAGVALTQIEVATPPDRTENEMCTTQTLTASLISHGVPTTQPGTDCVVQTDYGVLGHELMVLGTSSTALKLEAPGLPVLVPHSTQLFVSVESGFAGRYLRMYDNPIASFSRQTSNSSWGIAYKAVLPADWTASDTNGQPLQTDGVAASANGQWLVFRSATKLIRLNIATRQMLAFTNELPQYGSGLKLGVNLGISNDGRYVAFSGANTNALLLFDLAGCTSQADNQLVVPAGCGRLDLTSYMQARVAQYRDSRYFSFSDDGTQLNMYNTAAAGTKLYNTTLASPLYVSPPHIDYLGFGDSFSSGEGEIDNHFYLPGTDGNGVFQPGIETVNEMCHISTRSYPFLLKQYMGLNDSYSANVACSGAVTDDIYSTRDGYSGQFKSLEDLPPEARAAAQTDAINRFIPGRAEQIAFMAKYKPSAITITIGGNNLGFAGKLQECATSVGTCAYATASQDRANMGQEIRSQFTELKSLYSQLQHASPATKIYVVGYPQFVADPVATPNCTDSNAGALNNTERTFIRQSVGYFNGVIQAAAAASRVTYVDIEDSLDGHQICNGSGTSAAVNGLELGNDIFGLLGNESYHPNPVGHSMIAEAIRQRVGNLLTYTCTAQCADIPSSAPSLPAYFLIDGSAPIVPKQAPLSTTQRLQKDMPLTLQLNARYLAPGTIATVTVHSDPQVLGTITVDADGSLVKTVTLPTDLPAGIHTIHVTGTAPSGETVDLYQAIYVANPAPQTLQPLYRVRRGNLAKHEDPNRIYIERNTAQAALQMGINGDYDPDNDDWALVGRSKWLAFTPTTSLTLYMRGSTPLAIVKIKKRQCTAFTPTTLTIVNKGKIRRAEVAQMPSDATCT